MSDDTLCGIPHRALRGGARGGERGERGVTDRDERDGVMKVIPEVARKRWNPSSYLHSISFSLKLKWLEIFSSGKRENQRPPATSPIVRFLVPSACVASCTFIGLQIPTHSYSRQFIRHIEGFGIRWYLIIYPHVE